MPEALTSEGWTDRASLSEMPRACARRRAGSTVSTRARRPRRAAASASAAARVVFPTPPGPVRTISFSWSSHGRRSRGGEPRRSKEEEGGFLLSRAGARAARFEGPSRDGARRFSSKVVRKAEKNRDADRSEECRVGKDGKS